MKKGLNTNLRENLAPYQQLGWARKALILLLSVAGDFGFSGIVVAMLGSLQPVGIVIAALFMALISAGSVTMQVKTGIPVSFTSVLEALIVLFILLGMAVSAAQSKRKKVG